MDYTIFGQTLNIESLVMGFAIGIVLAVIISILTRFRKRKQRKLVKEIKQDLKEGHNHLIEANKIFQELYSFFDRVEEVKKKRREVLQDEQ